MRAIKYSRPTICQHCGEPIERQRTRWRWKHTGWQWHLECPTIISKKPGVVVLLGRVLRPKLKSMGIEGQISHTWGRLFDYDFIEVTPRGNAVAFYPVTVVWTSRESFAWSETIWRFLLLEEKE